MTVYISSGFPHVACHIVTVSNLVVSPVCAIHIPDTCPHHMLFHY